VVRFEPEDAVPAEASLRRDQGLPEGSPTPPRVRRVLDEALRRYPELVEPRGVIEAISTRDFVAVYEGEGRNAVRTLLDTIFPRADRLALFALTLGDRVTREVADLVRGGQLALGCMLDAVASAGAGTLADRLAGLFLGACRTEGVASADSLVLPYSPGHCGWDVSGQARLFDRLTPEEIGIDLSPRFLMRPLKSLSGVLVTGPREIHTVRGEFPFCDQCPSHPCRERMASVLGG
jgi:hypothetical protein